MAPAGFGPRTPPRFPETREDILAALAAEEPPAPGPAPTFGGGDQPGFLEHLGRAFPGGVPQPGGFFGGLASGLVGGLAAQGQQRASERAKFERALEEQRRRTTEADIKASQDRRAELLKGLSELRSEERLSKRDRERWERDHPKATAADVKAGIVRPDMIGQRFPIEWRKPVKESAADKQKPPTEFQAKAKFFGDRAREAGGLAVEGGLERRIVKKAFGLSAPGFMQDEDQRAYTRAKQAFTLALNRLESGANVTPTEFSRVESLYFVTPGDTEADARRKEQLRNSIVENLEKLQAPSDRAGAAAPAGPQVPATWRRVR